MNQMSLFNDEMIESTDWKWRMSENYPTSNGLKVFSCFACGGGSTMGYKLAGCDVVGCNEIDPRMNSVYVANHHPKYNYLEDIRDFNQRDDLPKELYNLDILDGSPPCSTFSMSGQRGDAWGVAKKFREGQKEQTLDDLPFIFIDTVHKLRPKVAIMENVEGLMLGNAWKYVQEIYSRFHKIGYKVKHWLLKGENMGVPQLRHRVFFIATRLDFNLDKIDMYFNYKPITFGEIRTDTGVDFEGDTYQELLDNVRWGDESLAGPCERLRNKHSFFNNKLIYDNKVNWCLTAKRVSFRMCDKKFQSNLDIIHTATFPEDFNFINDRNTNVHYICGMSVPPIMIKRVVERLIESGIFKN